MTKHNHLPLLLSLPFLLTSFHIFTEETNYISLWFGAVLAGAGVLLLAIHFTKGARG